MLLVLLPGRADTQMRRLSTEVVIVGGGTGGTAAAIQSARMGRKTLLIEPTQVLGGMLTAAGVSCTDGNDLLASGIWEEFRRALRAHYGKQSLATGWVSNTCFEPRVGDSVFKAWAAKEKWLELVFGYTIEKVIRKGNRITGLEFRNPKNQSRLLVDCKLVVDATELGDLLPLAGVRYDLGTDDPRLTGEKGAVRKTPIMQDLTWVAILKDYGPTADRTINRPPGYDSTRYFCCCTSAPCSANPWPGDARKMLAYARLPRSTGATMDKYMINWPAHGNDWYVSVVEEPFEKRAMMLDSARLHTLGFVYFIQTVLGFRNLGLADDELDGGLGWIPYHREGRRVKGLVQLAVQHLQRPYDFTLYRTGIAIGDYPIDHHHGKFPGVVPPLQFAKVPSFTIPLGSLLPAEILNLVVCDKSISVTNLVNGSTRLQPVVMLTGQAAGVVAALAAGRMGNTREVAVREVQSKLLDAGCYLQPFVDVTPADSGWRAIQRVGCTGILRGTGKSEGWANKTFFFPDSIIQEAELSRGLAEFEPLFPARDYKGLQPLSIIRAWDMIVRMQHLIRNRLHIPHPYPPIIRGEWYRKLQSTFHYDSIDPNRSITRRELAVLVDFLAEPAFEQPVDWQGRRKF